MKNKEFICYDWHELEDNSYECVCPGCECTIIVVGTEPFVCDFCDCRFTLGDQDEILKKLCKDCRHFTYIRQLKIPEVCLNCDRQSHFQSREGEDES